MNVKNKISQYFRDSPLRPLDLILILFFTLAIAKIISLNLSVEGAEGNWEKFKAENNCKLKLGEDGYEKSTWVCDDGKVHYGWRQQR